MYIYIFIYNKNSDSLMLANPNLAIAANNNSFPPNWLTAIFNCKL